MKTILSLFLFLASTFISFGDTIPRPGYVLVGDGYTITVNPIGKDSYLYNYQLNYLYNNINEFDTSLIKNSGRLQMFRKEKGKRVGKVFRQISGAKKSSLFKPKFNIPLYGFISFQFISKGKPVIGIIDCSYLYKNDNIRKKHVISYEVFVPATLKESKYID